MKANPVVFADCKVNRKERPQGLFVQAVRCVIKNANGAVSQSQRWLPIVVASTSLRGPDRALGLSVASRVPTCGPTRASFRRDVFYVFPSRKTI